MLSANQVKAVLKKENIRIKKRLGQNFLVDKRYIEKIIASCDIKKQDTVLEIGPGLGALTEPVSLSARRLIAVEADRDLCRILKASLSRENVQLLCNDVLKVDLKQLSETVMSKIKVIGNLPYYITSPVIIYLIENRNFIESAFITVQKEVAQRLVSQPSNKTYGSLSCFVQFYAKQKILFDIPKEAFYPQPKVESAFVNMEFPQNPALKVNNEGLFFKIINAAFNKRRKTILNALSGKGALNIDKETLGRILSELKIDPNRRGETFSLDEFAKLTEKMEVFCGR